MCRNYRVAAAEQARYGSLMTARRRAAGDHGVAVGTTGSLLTRVPVEYPESDGKPVAESDFQRYYLLYAVDVLGQHFRAQPDVYVSGNLLLYYEEGNPRAVVAPDVFVVKGVPNHRRRTYRLWEAPKGPDFVLEVTSRSTWREDQVSKPELYARLGVREYWQYDPTGDYLEPALQGAELRGGRYEALPAQQEGGLLVMSSAVLGLELHLEEGEFRFYDSGAGRTLDTREELEARLRDEAAARRAAEARVAELARLRERGNGQAGEQAKPNRSSP